MLERDPNMVQCMVCREKLNSTHDNVVQVENGYIHAGCLEEFCRTDITMPDLYKDFALENLSDFMEYVKSAS